MLKIDPRFFSPLLQDGYMVSSGNPVHEYIDGAIRHVLLRQGTLGIKVGVGGFLFWGAGIKG